jgi:hypothetical protein
MLLRLIKHSYYWDIVLVAGYLFQGNAFRSGKMSQRVHMRQELTQGCYYLAHVALDFDHPGRGHHCHLQSDLQNSQERI